MECRETFKLSCSPKRMRAATIPTTMPTIPPTPRPLWLLPPVDGAELPEADAVEVCAGDGAAAEGGVAGAVAGVLVAGAWAGGLPGAGAWAGGLPGAGAWAAGLPGPDVPARETCCTLSPASQQLSSEIHCMQIPVQTASHDGNADWLCCTCFKGLEVSF